MTADQAKDFGIIDRVLARREEVEALLPEVKPS
jgi:ATP-dependent protease ClpP protease subunit